VKRPGVVALTDGLTAVEAINQAGGLAEFGSLKGIRVVRDSPNGSEVMTVDLTAVMDGDRSKDVDLQDGDIVVVPRRWF
jgi:protein involved in polysaccharide export with SLBB domain